MSFDLRYGIVRILKQNGKTAGAGFVLTDNGLIATCSHVVQSHESQNRREPTPEERTVVFATGEQRQAWVDLNWWRSSQAEDVAVLRIDGVLPAHVKALPLGSSDGTSGHSFETFGFPEANLEGGLRGIGELLGETSIQGMRVLQLRSGEVTTGFSGTPVVDNLRRRVVGMITSITMPDKNGRLTETAFITPIETLRGVCDAIDLRDECPYRGLSFFTEKDNAFFFGREKIVDTLVDSLFRKDSCFLAVFGPSGCGKSSVVQAGLIPKLHDVYWDIFVTRPTDTDPPFQQWIAWLVQFPIQQQATQPGQFPRHVAVVIDQFEEVFVAFSQEEYQQIIMELTNVLEKKSPYLTLILVMRNDFYSLFMQHEALARWKQGHLVDIPPTIKRDEVVAMVKKPAEIVGWQFEDEGLIEAIANDTLETALNSNRNSGNSTVLPLLEFALTQLWDHRQGGVLTRNVYRRIGGVTGGLVNWADAAFNRFEERLHPLVRRTFMELIHLGNEDQLIPDSRRRRELTELVHNEAERNDIYQVVERLVDARLLVKSLKGGEEKVTVEIIHDALFQKWKRLKDWIAEKREILIWSQEHEERVEGWASERDEDKLLRRSELEGTWKFLESHQIDLNPHEQDFIKESKRRNRRVMMKQRLVAIAFLVLLVASLIASVVALIFQSNNVVIEKQHEKDQQRLLASLPVSVTNLNDHGPGSLREAIVQAPPGGAVTFAKTLRGTIRLTSGELKITKNLTISGPGAQALEISGGNTTRVFDISSNLIVSISNLTIRDGFTTQRSSEFSEGLGGGVYLDLLSQLALVNVIITENRADFGGGIYNHSGVLTLTNSIISHNSVRGDGGGIDNFGTLTLTDSTVAYNTTAQDGGGIKNTASLFLTNSTIATNTASGTGGGILNTEAGSAININYSTIYGNMAQAGGGMAIESGTEILEASIVAGNSASTAPDILGTVTLYWPSLIQNSTGTKISSSPVPSGLQKVYGPVPPSIQNAFELGKHSIFGKSPLLGPLQNNGGLTQTYALLPGSPAIDQVLPDTSGECGSNSSYPTDQRGVPRPKGAGCDLGSYEYVPS